MPDLTDEDEIPADATEIRKARIRRADLVGNPAHGMRFFIAKSAADTGDTVPDLVKSEADDVHDTAVNTPKLADERPTAAPGDPDDPGSAAWEAVDAANARAAINQLMSLRTIVGGLLERETLEVVTGAEETDDDAYDLDTALSALDCALQVLAPFAVTEQAEADERTEDTLVKAAAFFATAAARPYVGSSDQIVKAGRVLSGKNEAVIRGAVESLSKVLDSLPAATEADMTKAADSAVDPAEPTEVTPDPIVKAEDTEAPAEDVTKAAEAEAEADVVKADDLSSMSDDDLKRQAITGEDADRTAALIEIGLRALAGTPTTADDPAPATDESLDPAHVDPDAAPADDMSKSTDTEDDQIAKAFATQREELFAEFNAKLASMRDEVVKAVGDLPAPSRVLSNGAVPPADQLRGQDNAGERPALERAVDIIKAESDPDKRQQGLHEVIKAMHENR